MSWLRELLEKGRSAYVETHQALTGIEAAGRKGQPANPRDVDVLRKNLGPRNGQQTALEARQKGLKNNKFLSGGQAKTPS